MAHLLIYYKKQLEIPLLKIFYVHAVCVWVSVCECQCPWRMGVPGTLRAEVTGGCELCDMGAGNYTEGLCNLGALNC